MIKRGSTTHITLHLRFIYLDPRCAAPDSFKLSLMENNQHESNRGTQPSLCVHAARSCGESFLKFLAEAQPTSSLMVQRASPARNHTHLWATPGPGDGNLREPRFLPETRLAAQVVYAATDESTISRGGLQTPPPPPPQPIFGQFRPTLTTQRQSTYVSRPKLLL